MNKQAWNVFYKPRILSSFVLSPSPSLPTFKIKENNKRNILETLRVCGILWSPQYRGLNILRKSIVNL